MFTGPVFRQWGKRVLELPARPVLEFWCGLVQQLFVGKVSVFWRPGVMHELPLAPVRFASVFGWLLLGQRSQRVRELPCRKLFKHDGLVELRRLRSRPILGNSSVDSVRQLRLREVPIFNRPGIMEELSSRSILALDRIVGIDSVHLVRCGDFRI